MTVKADTRPKAPEFSGVRHALAKAEEALVYGQVELAQAWMDLARTASQAGAS